MAKGSKPVNNPRCPGCGALMHPAVTFVPEDHWPIRSTGCLGPTYEKLVERFCDSPPMRRASHPVANDAKAALALLLDQVDYERGACGLTEMVGACLPAEVLDIARKAAGKP